MNFCLSLLLASAIAFTPEDAKLAHSTAAGLVNEHTPRHGGTLRAHLAAEWLLDRVSRTGADAEIITFQDDTPDGIKSFGNLIVEWKSENPSAPWVILISHYDTAPTAGPNFQGANDGASTSGLLVALVKALRRAGRQADNIAFVWTDGEECRKAYAANDGFHGSRHLVKYFKEKARNVKCAICLDMLGDKDLNIIVPANGDRALRKIAAIAAQRAGLTARQFKLEDELTVSDDHVAFIDAGIAAIDLIDFEFGSAPGLNDFWHTPADTMDKVSEESLLTSGKLVAALLNLIERNKTE